MSLAELAIVVVIALLVMRPRQIQKICYTLGRLWGRGQDLLKQFTHSLDDPTDTKPPSQSQDETKQ